MITQGPSIEKEILKEDRGLEKHISWEAAGNSCGNLLQSEIGNLQL